MCKWGIVETVMRWRSMARGQRLSARLRLEIFGDECSARSSRTESLSSV